jgi:hypothetical protein
MHNIKRRICKGFTGINLLNAPHNETSDMFILQRPDKLVLVKKKQMHHFHKIGQQKSGRVNKTIRE